MAVPVQCPTCTKTHEMERSGHRNIVCSKCNTEFSVVTKYGRVTALAKVHRAKSNATAQTKTKERTFREHEHVGRSPKSKYQTRALWFSILLLLIFIARYPQPILLIIIGLLIAILAYNNYR